MLPTIGCHGEREPSGGNSVSDTHEVPFYDRDGEHWLTVEIEVDAVSYTHLTLPTTPYV